MTRKRFIEALRHSSALALACVPVAAQQDPPGPPPVDDASPAVVVAERALARFTVRDWLVLAPVDGRGRRPLRPDAVLRERLLKTDAKAPLPGEIERGEVGAAHWAKLEAREDGTLEGEDFAWAYATIEREVGGVWIANLQGANTLYVNGEAFQGDVYRYGFGGVPVLLKAGVNQLYVNGVRGGFQLRFEEPPATQFTATFDRTLPDVAGPFAVIEVNASNDWTAQGDPPLSITKRARDTRDVADGSGTVQGFGAPFGVMSEAPNAKYVTTFVSEIDGSVQSMGVSPPTRKIFSRWGLVLSLHGAGVPVRNQLGAHSRHENLWIFVPTNRRPYGFDWQDWGRRDAYEVLERGIAMSGVLRDRLYLLGHSMGGHGTWHLAANDPDTWAAIQPSAGWCSFDTYGSRPAGELAELWQDADGASRTLDMIGNLAQIRTFVVHGDADETVPISEAHAMVSALEAAGGFPETHYQAGGGHWWDGDASDGADCLEWSGAFELFRQTKKFAPLFDFDPHGHLDWTTVDPAVDSRHAWIGVEQVQVQGKPARVTAERVERIVKVGSDNLSVGLLNLALEAENVRVLRVDIPEELPSEGAVVTIGEPTGGWTYDVGGVRYFEQRGEEWIERGAPDPAREKTPARNGNFKRAFDKRFYAVVGTQGDDGNDAALLARARHDAEQWWYRGNGHFETLTDVAIASKRIEPNRNRILYGNRDTNSAWTSSFPADCPVIVENGRVQIGDRVWKGDDLACLFTYPLEGSDACVVGAFGFTGPQGARIAASFGTFVSGAGFPDLVLVDSSVLTNGDGGVLAAGWFENDWSWAGGRLERGGELMKASESAERDDE